MPPCKYCNADTDRRFAYEGREFYICEDCARCFLCGGVVDPGDELFYALSYEAIGYDVNALKRENPRVILGREDFGIVIHSGCVLCMVCRQVPPLEEIAAYIAPSGRIMLTCANCHRNLEIT